MNLTFFATEGVADLVLVKITGAGHQKITKGDVFVCATAGCKFKDRFGAHDVSR